MKEKYFEVTICNRDENSKLPPWSLYCRACRPITLEEAIDFFGNGFIACFERVLSIKEISREEVKKLTGGKDLVIPFVDKARVWKIPVTYSVCGVVEVEADTLEDAMDIAYTKDGSIPLPEDAEYVPGSWELSETDVDFVRACYNNNRQDLVQP